MTDKEFKRLSRSQLIDIIYKLQLRQDELTAENERLSAALEDKRIRVCEAGNVAEAALELHDVMEAAQSAAEHYREEMQLRAEEEYRRILEAQKQKQKEDRAAAAVIVRQARHQAMEIVAKAKAEAEEIRLQARREAAEALAAANVQKEKAAPEPAKGIFARFRSGR